MGDETRNITDPGLDRLRLLASESDPNGRVELEILGLWYDVLRRPGAAALVAHRRLVDEYLPWIERRLVARARREGVSWTGIGRLLGRSRQAVQQRHDRVWSVADLLAPGALSGRHPHSQESHDATADRRRVRDADDAAAAGSLVPW